MTLLKWVRSAGCEELHCVELRLPLQGALSKGLDRVGVKAILHARVDDDRPRRFTLSDSLRRALRLTKCVETKPVLVAAVCEALRRRGLLPGAPGASSGAGTMLSCDADLQDLLGTPSFPFGQLQDALGPHVEPAEPSSLAATVSLKEGSTEEQHMDVRVHTETPFQLQAARSLLGSDGSGGDGGGGGGGDGGGDGDGGLARNSG
ncbi:unnamed protein product, partial [Laminaria digitata]